MNGLIPSDAAIDTTYLRHKFPELAALEREGYSLGEIGSALVRKSHRKASRYGKGHPRAGTPEEPAAPGWIEAKAILHDVFCTGKPDFDGIRQRLTEPAAGSTPHLHATLSLWLAGHLGQPVSVVSPLVATVLYGIARDGIESWCSGSVSLDA